MDPVDDPFRLFDAIHMQVKAHTPVFFVDFHAEATSEKVALGWHADGRASTVIGTHTHVQTADERILPQGTACLTDAGMCGALDSVIGMETETALARFTSGMPQRYKVAEGRARLCGVIVPNRAADRPRREDRARRQGGITGRPCIIRNVRLCRPKGMLCRPCARTDFAPPFSAAPCCRRSRSPRAPRQKDALSVFSLQRGKRVQQRREAGRLGQRESRVHQR